MEPNATGAPARRKSAIPIRYSARGESIRGNLIELGCGTNFDELVSTATTYHSKTGNKSWVWSLRTGDTKWHS